MPGEIENHLGRLRQKRGLTAASLAKLAGVSRQTIYAIEAGTYVPNTALTLKLARILEATVEELFSLPDFPAPTLRAEPVTLLPGGPVLHAGQPVQICRVDRQTIASAPSAVPWYFPASDAVVASEVTAGKTKVQVFHPE